MLARFYGNIETNRGEGAVFELIRDHNGEVSKTLEHYFSANNKTDLNYQDLSQALPLLKQYLLKVITVGDTVMTEANGCIHCSACVKICPTGARIWKDSRIRNISEWLSTNYYERKEPEMFI